MNPLLARLHPYPFERLRALTREIVPNPALRPIGLGIGEPRHAFDVAARFTLPERSAKRPPRFLRVAAMRHRFCDVRFQFLIDLVDQAIAANDVDQTRPDRHITPSSAHG